MIEDTLTLSRLHFAHNTLWFLHNILLYYKEHFTVLTIGQVSARLQYSFVFNIIDYSTPERKQHGVIEISVTVSFSSILHKHDVIASVSYTTRLKI